MRIYKTSEWVSIGHPDKVADYISEYILDRLIEQDPNTRYALEVQIKDWFVTLAGEVTTSAKSTDVEQWVKDALNEIGYTANYAKRFGVSNTIYAELATVEAHIAHQSPDIAKGVDKQGWGDQGIFFGYYCDETPTGQGLEFELAKEIGTALYQTALTNSNLGIDIKTQVTVSYAPGTDPMVEEIIVAIPMPLGREGEGKKAVKKIIKAFKGCKEAAITINGTGKYTQHGPLGDCGTTGRKLVVDFYGGRSRIGGGSPWTKDGTKADLTLNLFAHELAREYFKELRKANAPIDHVEVELSCCIGKQEVLLTIQGYDKENVLLYIASDMNKVKTNTLIERYKLNTPIFAKMCRDGLFSLFDKPESKGNKQ